MKTILFLAIALMVSVNASVLNFSSSVYGGSLFINDKATGSACYVQINEVFANSIKGKHCHNLNIQFLFGLPETIHSLTMEIVAQSCKTNTEYDFHKPTTCGEVVPGVVIPSAIDRWSDDTEFLYNQVFAAEAKVNRFQNHYTLIMRGDKKEPTRAMIHRVEWLREDSYECRNLTAM